MERIGEKGRIHGHLLKSAVSLFFCVFGVDCNDTVKNTILSGSPAKKITDLEARISNLEKQKDNIVEPRVSGIVSKEDCEKKYASITKEIEMAKGELDRHQDRKREQSEMKGKGKEFKETILKHKRIDEFQREILETTVDKIIVGGFDDDGNPDSHRMNFIFKCGVSANAVYSRCFFDYFLKRLCFLCDTGRFISTIDFLICLLSLQIFRKYKKLPR